MARGRMISKTLGTASRKFARLRADYPDVGLFAQALYPLFVANADDWGRQKADPFTVKHSVWSTAPEDETVFSAALVAMVGVGLILLYTIDGETYAQVVDFDAHQVGLQKRTNARMLPAPPNMAESSANSTTSANFVEVQESRGNSSLRELNLTEQKRREPARVSEDDTAQAALFEQFWARYPKQQGKPAAWAAWLLIRPTAEHAAEIMAGLERWRASKGWQEAITTGDPRFIKGAAKWLGEAAWMELTTTAGSVRVGPRNCRHRPTCADDVVCTARATAERERAGGAAVVQMPVAAAGGAR